MPKMNDEELIEQSREYIRSWLTVTQTWRNEVRRDYEYVDGDQWSDTDRAEVEANVGPSAPLTRLFRSGGVFYPLGRVPCRGGCEDPGMSLSRPYPGVPKPRRPQQPGGWENLEENDKERKPGECVQIRFQKEKNTAGPPCVGGKLINQAIIYDAVNEKSRPEDNRNHGGQQIKR